MIDQKDIPKVFEPQKVESKWYEHWLNNHYFNSQPDPNKKPYTIVMPPPNVTGVLHMGHMLNNTIQDVLIRRKRMQGYNACWVPGTDHASIATEAKVVKMLAEKGIKKSDLNREEFLKYAWEWKEKYGGIILEQLKKLGASCDWKRTTFTMDEKYSDSVLNAFIDLYRKGYIYRGYRMINWDPVGLTALSDEEVIYKESNSQLVFVKYFLEDNSGHITIATTRPETIMADVAVCVHPDDQRYKHLIGKKVIVPIVNRIVPIIADTYIDPTFGTGALKVTPAHDIADYELGVKHQLPIIIGLTPDGKISKEIIDSPRSKYADQYIGLDRFVCRKKIIKDLEELGLIQKIETIKNKVGHSERTDAVVEPYLSYQWFVKMNDISKAALDAVLKGDVKLIPDKFINTYKHWMENVKDWCISRQLWWGHRIPAWYNENNDIAVCKTKEEAIEFFQKNNLSTNNVRQDEDVLDTWFSSWLWPISVFDPTVVGSDKKEFNDDFKYYYPTNDLVTAPEILFFWVARMIIAGYLWGNNKPFTNVYLTGIVRDKLGRKMSKSLGNSPDPLDLIEKYGADAVRVGMLFSSPAGNDLLFDEEYCVQGRNFANKIWNAFRLIHQLQQRTSTEQNIHNYQSQAIELFENYFYKQLDTINDAFEKFRLNDALMLTYKLIWDDFCSWYLEAIKPNDINEKINSNVIQKTIELFENILKILHPWMPFVSEEIWHLLKNRKDKEDLIIQSWPETQKYNLQLVELYEDLKNIVTQIREVRARVQISPKEKLNWTENISYKHDNWIEKLAHLNTKQISENTSGKLIVHPSRKIYLNIEEKISGLNIETIETEIKKLSKELEYLQGFLESVQKKLSNEKFIQNAKSELVEKERQKEKDTLQKIEAIRDQLQKLKTQAL
ncbi:MAG: valine--tRNA ligase [Bacteroidia bacterium]|nr:MAG: valine--tRNA ligase [Bacteroidia bacterium]